MIDLQPFCGTSEFRPHLLKPWSRDGFTWATDGRVLVRVPANDYPAQEDSAAPNPWTAAAFDHDSLNSEWIEMPELPEPESYDCEKCDGTGKARQCRECKGEGRCVCECDHEHDCGYCDGTGFSGAEAECQFCDQGKVKVVSQVEIGEAVFNADFLRKIAALPNPLFAKPVTCEAPMAFKFDGGVGYLMPMRKEAP